MKAFTLLLVAAGVASAATVPNHPRRAVLAVRQNSTEEADVETQIEDDISDDSSNDSSSNLSSSLNFDDFSINDFINLGVTDVLNIDNISQHELDLATALSAMLGGLGFGGQVTVNDFVGFGFNAQLQMFLAFQQIAQLLSLGRIGVNDAFGLIRGNLLNFGFNGFNGFNGLQGLGGFGSGLRGLNGLNNLNLEDIAASLGK